MAVQVELRQRRDVDTIGLIARKPVEQLRVQPVMPSMMMISPDRRCTICPSSLLPVKKIVMW